MTTSPAKRVLLGHIATAHGIRGEVVIKSYAADPADIAAYGALHDEAGKRSFTIKVVRVTPKGVVARVAGVNHRNAAEALRGIALYVDRTLLDAPAPGEYYHADLVGLAAHDPAGSRIGTVKTVQNFGAGDLLEIAFDGSARTEFVAFTDANVPEVDIANGRVIVVVPTDDGSKPEDEPKDDS